ncbi:YpoC family protein [Jeotgalibacillus campisalis]|uniref:YpoC-like domain-containing protein n=1 Tax=Jeotgalibacillus campisalis TaxID=220754 RepID=A0A0C2VUD5_9BACL|nr:hypothetical protein [Jeotgalibacillus campisalis]KIL48026.1 hypothetical protein KR50_21930 [Jeotgalibacillus campisalis]
MNNKIELQNRYKNELFFSGDEIELALPLKEGGLFQPYFQPEFQWSQTDQRPPWEEINYWLPLLKEEWELINDRLTSNFDKNNPAVKQDMVKGFSIFFMMLFWSNGKPVDVNSWKESSLPFKTTCLNLIERLEFALNNADSYFARIQLNELVLEIHKKSAKKLALQSVQKKSPKE